MRYLKAVDTSEPSPQPRLVGIRGSDNHGLMVVFDHPAVLVSGEAGSIAWHVPWANLGEALIAFAEHEARRA
jgi:hypothetical protein